MAAAQPGEGDSSRKRPADDDHEDRPSKAPRPSPQHVDFGDASGGALVTVLPSSEPSSPQYHRTARPRKWTNQEDAALRAAVAEFGERRWKAIASRVPTRDHVQCLQRWRKALQPGLKKGHWSREEDAILREEVARRPRNWGDVAVRIPGRTAKQCRERWSNHLDPSIKRTPWTPEEDAILEHLVTTIGSRWASISRKLPGRTENAVKIRAKSLERQRRRGDRPHSPSMSSATAAGVASGRASAGWRSVGSGISPRSAGGESLLGDHAAGLRAHGDGTGLSPRGMASAVDQLGPSLAPNAAALPMAAQAAGVHAQPGLDPRAPPPLGAYAVNGGMHHHGPPHGYHATGMAAPAHAGAPAAWHAGAPPPPRPTAEDYSPQMATAGGRSILVGGSGGVPPSSAAPHPQYAAEPAASSGGAAPGHAPGGYAPHAYHGYPAAMGPYQAASYPGPSPVAYAPFPPGQVQQWHPAWAPHPAQLGPHPSDQLRMYQHHHQMQLRQAEALRRQSEALAMAQGRPLDAAPASAPPGAASGWAHGHGTTDRAPPGPYGAPASHLAQLWAANAPADPHAAQAGHSGHDGRDHSSPPSLGAPHSAMDALAAEAHARRSAAPRTAAAACGMDRLAAAAHPQHMAAPPSLGAMQAAGASAAAAADGVTSTTAATATLSTAEQSEEASSGLRVPASAPGGKPTISIPAYAPPAV